MDEGVSRHRAVLAAYGVKTDATGKPVLTPSQIAARRRQEAERLERLERRTEAARALQWYWSISAVALATTLGVTVSIVRDADPFNRVESPWWLQVAVFVVGLAVLVGAQLGMNTIMKRVVLAGGPQDPRDRHGGWVLVALAALCIAAGWAIRADRIADEPVVAVDSQVSCYLAGRNYQCRASWDYDGHGYGGQVPTSLGEGPRQIEISAAHPYVMITGQDEPLTRYSVWIAGLLVLVSGARWLSRSLALTRRLRRAARGNGGPALAAGPTIGRLATVDPSFDIFLPPGDLGPHKRG